MALCSLIASSWSGVDVSPALAAVVIAAVRVGGVAVEGYNQEGQFPELLAEHRYDVRRILAGVEYHLAALVFEARRVGDQSFW